MTNMIDRVSEAIVTICTEEMVPRFRALDAEEISSKDGGDVVTIVDTICERRLIGALTALLPGSMAVGEEGVAADSSLLDRLAGSGDIWLIDPLDGTRNFANGVADFASMVALVRNGQVVAGWIYIPSTGIMAVAERGGGTLIDGVRRSWQDRKPVSEMAGVYNIPASGPRRERLLVLRGSTKSQTSVGCAGSAYVNLIRGVADFATFNKLHPWDHAPGSVMVEEAGGVARLVDGTPYSVALRKGPMIAAQSENDWQTLAALMQTPETVDAIKP